METAALPLCYYPIQTLLGLDFLVCRALTAVGAEFNLLQTLGHRLFVPSRRVVPLLAIATS